MYYRIFKNKINNGSQSLFLENTTSLINKYNVCVTRNNTMFYLIIVNTIQLKTGQHELLYGLYIFFSTTKLCFIGFQKKIDAEKHHPK